MCACVHRAATARRISLGGEGNALYPVLSIVIIIGCGTLAVIAGEVMSLSPISSACSSDTSPADDTSASATADAAATSPHDEPPGPDEPPTVTSATEDNTDEETKDRRPTAFVVDLGGDDTAEFTNRRLPSDPLSRYVPPRVERSSARRRADIIKRRICHREVQQ